MEIALEMVLVPLLTTMLKGAAKTATAIDTQTHPTTTTRRVPCIVKKVTKKIKAKEPTFITINNLTVNFCNKKPVTLISVNQSVTRFVSFQ